MLTAKEETTDGGRRNDAFMALRLPKAIDDEIRTIAREGMTSRASLIRQALVTYIRERRAKEAGDERA